MDSLEAEPEMGVGMHVDVLSGRKGLREAEQGEQKSSVRTWGSAGPNMMPHDSRQGDGCTLVGFSASVHNLIFLLSLSFSQSLGMFI